MSYDELISYVVHGALFCICGDENYFLLETSRTVDFAVKLNDIKSIMCSDADESSDWI